MSGSLDDQPGLDRSDTRINLIRDLEVGPLSAEAKEATAFSIPGFGELQLTPSREDLECGQWQSVKSLWQKFIGQIPAKYRGKKIRTDYNYTLAEWAKEGNCLREVERALLKRSPDWTTCFPDSLQQPKERRDRLDRLWTLFCPRNSSSSGRPVEISHVDIERKKKKW